MREDTYLQIHPEEFDLFKRQLLSQNRKGAYHMVELQKFSYENAMEMLKTGKTVKGEPLTADEVGYLKRIIEDIKHNLRELKQEFEEYE